MLLCRRILFQFGFRPTAPSFTVFSSNLLKTALNGHISRRYVRTRADVSQSRTALLETLVAFSESQKKTADKVKARMPVLQAYKHLRTFDRSVLAELPLQTHFDLLEQAVNMRLAGVMTLLVEDILQKSPADQRSESVSKILASNGVSLLPSGMLLELLQSLPKTSAVSQLELSNIAVLARAVADAPPGKDDASLVKLVFPLLHKGLRALKQPRGDAILTYRPPMVIQATFAFIDRLLHLSEEQRALTLFQILVNSGNIPSEAVQTIEGLNGFASIIRSSLVRACSHWQWRSDAERFLSPLLKGATPPSPQTISLTIDTLYACLEDDPTPGELRACQELIMQVHPIQPVPNGVVREFYAATQRVGAHAEARALYTFSRTEEVLATHRYPCARGNTLAWLMDVLLDANSYYAKVLGEEILDENILLPPDARPRIVQGLATRGHATLARSLWMRCAAASDGESFVRKSSVMLRMVSLFHHLVKREEDILAKRAGQEFPDDEEVRERARDFKEFLDLVLSEFERAHAPIEKAEHRIVTSQARAYFMIGEFIRGFDTLKILFTRQEMPDIYDVNVTLTVMAEHNPRTAAEMIERMISRGLQPDPITYGTVMHHALVHGDMELVEEMVERVREVQNRELSLKSIAALVRGSVAHEADTWFAQRAKLRSVFNIIRAVGNQAVVATPAIGKYLAFAALRADDPVMAYRFWEQLSKDRADWHDKEQIYQRRLIMSYVKRHEKKGWMKEAHARAMVAQLRKEPGNA